MQALMDEAARDGLPVRLKVASSNDPSMRLYQRLGFRPIDQVPFYIEMEWKAPSPMRPPPPEEGRRRTGGVPIAPHADPSIGMERE